VLPKRDLLNYLVESGVMKRRPALTNGQQDAPPAVVVEDKVLQDWAKTAHARAGVNCADCHLIEDRAAHSKRWSDRLDQTVCAPCHQDEVAGFLGGKHGMRLARGLSPMTPAQARLPMKSEAAHRQLRCVSCHEAHEFDTRRAAMDACLSCHDDEHSLAFKRSKHAALWQNELDGEAPAGIGVSCATCHLPREIHGSGGEARVLVQHNQNLNLRPNEKMIRTVCLNCHGLEFSLDALADTALVRSNFTGQPSRHIESMDMARQRQVELQNTKTKTKTETKP